MAAKTRIDDPLANAGKRLIHEFHNYVHLTNMELDLAELRGLENSKYADLMSAVDSMNRSLEVLRVQLVDIEKRVVALKNLGQLVD